MILQPVTRNSLYSLLKLNYYFVFLIKGGTYKVLIFVFIFIMHFEEPLVNFLSEKVNYAYPEIITSLNKPIKWKIVVVEFKYTYKKEAILKLQAAI